MVLCRAMERRAALSSLLRRGLLRHSNFQRYATRKNSFLHISEEVQEALHAKKPVVALETTIYTHGFPYPDNVALASRLESIVRMNGGIPATIGILDGIARVGMSPEELVRLTESAGNDTTLKLSRRDLGYICGVRLAGKNFNGGTTISGTMVLAHLAGIKVFATGGLGGVHRGAESSMDISADLTELGRTPVTVISSGCKSFLDIPRTLEYLETQGVGVATFADGRTGNVDFPAFWSRDSGVRSPVTISNEIEAAAIIYAQNSLPLESGLHFANPIPEEASIPKDEMDHIIAEAIKQADLAGATGKDNTPFILSKIKELSGTKSITANRALIESNVRRGTIVARELAVLEAKERQSESGTGRVFAPLSQTQQSDFPQLQESPAAETLSSRLSKYSRTREEIISFHGPEIVVAGALAVDFACDYAPLVDALSDAAVSPQLHTSNPSTIIQTLGGVAHNIARSAHLVGGNVRLCSAVGNDLSGHAAISNLQSGGIRTDGIEILDDNNTYRTAQYIAVNDAHKNLMLAMADMSILESISAKDLDAIWLSGLKSNPPRCLVADANWSPSALRSWFHAGKNASAITVFEPVSTAKSTRLFTASPNDPNIPIFPNHIVDIASPNIHEVAALHNSARRQGLFDRQDWWHAIDSLGIPSSGLRTALAMITSSSLVDQGLPQQSIQLLPFIPALLTKLGPRGVLLTMLLPADDSRLHNADDAPYVLSRSKNGSKDVGGLYMRLFEPEEVLGSGEVVSVNGVGDTFIGATVAGIVNGKKIEDVIATAQKAAILSLRSKESVSPELTSLRGYWQN